MSRGALAVPLAVLSGMAAAGLWAWLFMPESLWLGLAGFFGFPLASIWLANFLFRRWATPEEIEYARRNSSGLD